MEDFTFNPSTRASLLRDLGEPEKREAAWQTFLERYLPLIEAWCRRKGLQEADVQDVSGQILLKLTKAMPTFVYDPERGGFRYWLRTVVLNTLRNFWRDRVNDPVGVGSQLDNFHAQPESAQLDAIGELIESMHAPMESEHRRALSAVARAKSEVHETTWRVFELTVLDGKSGPEVAELLQIPVGKVYVYKKRVLDRIKAIVAQANGRMPDGSCRT